MRCSLLSLLALLTFSTSSGELDGIFWIFPASDPSLALTYTLEIPMVDPEPTGSDKSRFIRSKNPEPIYDEPEPDYDAEDHKVIPEDPSMPNRHRPTIFGFVLGNTNTDIRKDSGNIKMDHKYDSYGPKPVFTKSYSPASKDQQWVIKKRYQELYHISLNGDDFPKSEMSFLPFKSSYEYEVKWTLEKKDESFIFKTGEDKCLTFNGAEQRISKVDCTGAKNQDWILKEVDMKYRN